MSEPPARHHGEPLWMCVPRHIGLRWCVCLTILETPLGVCLFSPQRRDLCTVQATCPLGVVSTTLPHNTGHLPTPEPTCLHIPGLLSIRIRVSVQQMLNLPIWTGLRWWWVQYDRRNNVRCLWTPILYCKTLSYLPGT